MATVSLTLVFASVSGTMLRSNNKEVMEQLQRATTQWGTQTIWFGKLLIN